jgi:hypothetical protein
MMMRITYYWPDIGQTAEHTVELLDDMQDDATMRIVEWICERNFNTDGDLWDGGERTVAVIRDGVESRWTVEAEEIVTFTATKERKTA